MHGFVLEGVDRLQFVLNEFDLLVPQGLVRDERRVVKRLVVLEVVVGLRGRSCGRRGRWVVLLAWWLLVVGWWWIVRRRLIVVVIRRLDVVVVDFRQGLLVVAGVTLLLPGGAMIVILLVTVVVLVTVLVVVFAHCNMNKNLVKITPQSLVKLQYSQSFDSKLAALMTSEHTRATPKFHILHILATKLRDPSLNDASSELTLSVFPGR